MQSKGSIISLLRKPPRLSSGKTKSTSGLLEQGLVIVGEHEVEAEPLQDLARLDMVERVVAVLGVEPARPFGVLGDEHDAQPLLGFGRDGERADGLVTTRDFAFQARAARRHIVPPLRR